MEIRAISALRRARPDGIAVSPSGSGFVVAHGGDHVVVDGARFRQWILNSACLLRGKFSNHSLERHKAIRPQEPLQITRARTDAHSNVRRARISGERNAMLLPPRLKSDAHLRRTANLFRWHLQIRVFIPVFRISMRAVRERGLDFQLVDRLIRIRLRQRNPNPRNFRIRGQSGNSGEIRKFEAADASAWLRQTRKPVPDTGDHRNKSKRHKRSLARFHGEIFLQASTAWRLNRVDQLKLQTGYLPAGPAVSGLLK